MYAEGEVPWMPEMRVAKPTSVPASVLLFSADCAVCGAPAITKQVKTVLCSEPRDKPYTRTEVESFCELHDECDLRTYGRMGLVTPRA